MRAVTAIGAVVIILGLSGVAFFAISGGLGSAGSLSVRWVSDTAQPGQPNHHAPAAGTVDGMGMVYAPVSATGDGQCNLVGLYSENGSSSWNYPIPQANCTLHSIADPAFADHDDDGIKEVFVATTEQAVIGFHPLSGAVEFRQNLSSYGYTRPLVTDFSGGNEKEIIVVDVKGTVFVFRPNGTVAWKRQLSTYTWGQPRVADFNGDGEEELAVGLGGSGELYLFNPDGSVVWNRSSLVDGSITWMTTGQADADDSVEIALAGQDGVVAMIEGRDGSVQWRRDLGTLAAVHAFGDGDEDGETELYAVAADGVLRSYTANNGTEEWRTTLTEENVQMTPPPSLGDIDGDGEPELVAVTNNGIVSVVDPRTGDVLDSYRREVPIWVHPTLADVTGDGIPEVFVIYGDGRVVSFQYIDD